MKTIFRDRGKFTYDCLDRNEYRNFRDLLALLPEGISEKVLNMVKTSPQKTLATFRAYSLMTTEDVGRNDPEYLREHINELNCLSGYQALETLCDDLGFQKRDTFTTLFGTPKEKFKSYCYNPSGLISDVLGITGGGYILAGFSTSDPVAQKALIGSGLTAILLGTIGKLKILADNSGLILNPSRAVKVRDKKDKFIETLEFMSQYEDRIF